MKLFFFNDDLSVYRRNRSLLIFESILFFILGCLAIAKPVITTLAADYFFGILFIFGGIIQIYRSFKTLGTEGAWLAMLFAWLTFIAGCVMIARPTIGIFAITTILIVYFLIGGITKASFAFQITDRTNRFWMIVNAALSIILALLILLGLPQTAFWVLGLFIGIDLLFFSVLLAGFTLSLSKNS